MAVVGILVVSVVIIAIDLPPLLKKKIVKELWVFSILLLFGVMLSIAQAFNIRIPNPLDWLTVIYKPFSDMLKNLK